MYLEEVFILGPNKEFTVQGNCNYSGNSLFYGELYWDPNGTHLALVAFAGGGQTNATAIKTPYSRFATVATTNDSGKLPTAQFGLGKMGIVTNAGANTLRIFPQVGEILNGVTNGNYDLAPGKTAMFIALSPSAWTSLSFA